jgi:putative glutamine amidotransferase
MLKKKPVIAVCGPDEGGWVAWYLTWFALWRQGAKAVRVTPGRPVRIDKIHGIVIGGGADIDPSRYKEKVVQSIQEEVRRVPRVNLTFLISVAIWLARKIFSIPSTRSRNDLDRDALEFGLLAEACARRMPVLGICRGGQLINVFFGGTLYQDINSFYVESPKLRTVRARKLILVEGGTALARILNHAHLKVNSLHDQSVKDLGRELRVSAREPNGVVQAIEHASLPFVIGVQWHPEFLPLHPEERRIFFQLVEAAKVHARLRTGERPIKSAHCQRPVPVRN